MPCYDPRGREDNSEAQWRWHYSLFEHDSPLAEMMCKVIKNYLSGYASYLNEVPGLMEWWEDHKKRDLEKDNK